MSKIEAGLIPRDDVSQSALHLYRRGRYVESTDPIYVLRRQSASAEAARFLVAEHVHADNIDLPAGIAEERAESAGDDRERAFAR